MFNLINFKTMKRVNFKNSVIALAIGMATVSCGGSGSNQQSGTATSETAKVEAKANDYANQATWTKLSFEVPKDFKGSSLPVGGYGGNHAGNE
jgi:hypothetical protein